MQESKKEITKVDSLVQTSRKSNKHSRSHKQVNSFGTERRERNVKRMK